MKVEGHDVIVGNLLRILGLWSQLLYLRSTILVSYMLHLWSAFKDANLHKLSNKGKFSLLVRRAKVKSSVLSSVSTRTLSLTTRDHTFALLGLKRFSDAEIKDSFERLRGPTSVNEYGIRDENETVDVRAAVSRLASTEYTGRLDNKQIMKINNLIFCPSADPAAKSHSKASENCASLAAENQGAAASAVGAASDATPALPPLLLTYSDYRQRVLALADKLDSRVWNIGLSFLCTGNVCHSKHFPPLFTKSCTIVLSYTRIFVVISQSLFCFVLFCCCFIK
jgi:hypothetical protein